MLVIGGGAAGMIAAIRAAEVGAKVRIIEKNEKLGKKLYITGKGRCNLTNACTQSEFFSNVRDNPKFMMSAYSVFDNKSIMERLEKLRVPLIIERGNRVFPKSGKSSDIISALRRELERLGVEIYYNTKVLDIQKSGTDFVVKTQSQTYRDKTLIIATGGISYQATGSTGEGYAFATTLGHNIIEPKPSLVGLVVDNTHKLSGLTLKNVEVTALCAGKVVASEFGELLYTHIGLSGPTILTLSSYINRLPANQVVEIAIDLKPRLSYENLDDRILKDFSLYSNKYLVNAMDKLLPKRLIEEVIKQSKLDQNILVNQITKKERTALVSAVKQLKYRVNSLDIIDNAIITSGGVCCKQIHPKTMESKTHSGLFFAGEVLDVSALTGGFNLQIAWSTGFVAGENAAKYELEKRAI